MNGSTGKGFEIDSDRLLFSLITQLLEGACPVTDGIESDHVLVARRIAKGDMKRYGIEGLRVTIGAQYMGLASAA